MTDLDEEIGIWGLLILNTEGLKGDEEKEEGSRVSPNWENTDKA